MSDLPQGWQLIRLGDVCEPSQYGYTAKAGPSGNIRFLRTTDITSGPIDWDSVPFCTVDDETREKYLLHDGDVVISRAGSVGYSCLIREPQPSVFASYLIRFRPKINADYFKYFLLTPNYWSAIGEQSLGIAVQNVNATNLSEIDVPIAPAAEQTRIVAKLEELLSDLDAGVAELKTAQKKLGQYRQSLLKAAVEGALTADWRTKNTPAETGAQLLERILTERRARWEAKQLAKFKEQGKKPPKDWQKKYPEPVQPDISELSELPEGWVWASVDCLLSDIETGKSFKCEERPPHAHEVGVVKVSAVSWGEYNEQESKTCHDESKVRPELFVNEGDFLFSRANTIELVGACVIAKSVTKRVMLSDKILRLILVDDELKTWLLTLLRSEFGRQYIERLASGNQESMRNIGQERLRQIPVPLPCSDEITKASELLSENILAAQEQEHAIIISLKQSTAQRQNILRAAFAGELVPQDPNDEPARVLLERIRSERAERAKQPKALKTKKRKSMNPSNSASLIDWIKSFQGNEFSFDDIRIENSGDYERLKNSLFELLTDENPVIEQFFDSNSGALRFRKVK